MITTNAITTSWAVISDLNCLKKYDGELPLCITEDILANLIQNDPTISEIELGLALLAVHDIDLTYNNNEVISP